MVLADYKIFHMVDHATLLSKLEAYNLDENALLWFKTYLTVRTQLDHSWNSHRPFGLLLQVFHILGPLLFVMFINDLPLHAHTQVDIFADNISLLTASDFANVEDLENTRALSREVSNIYEWATNEKLTLNCSKTKTIPIDGQRVGKRLNNEDRKLEIKLKGCK